MRWLVSLGKWDFHAQDPANIQSFERDGLWRAEIQRQGTTVTLHQNGQLSETKTY